MALDSARFSLKLVDGVSGPSKRSAKSLDELQSEIRETERAVMRLEKIQARAASRGSAKMRKASQARIKAQRLELRHLRTQARHAKAAQRVNKTTGGGGSTFASMLGANLSTAALGLAGRAVSGAGRMAIEGAGSLIGRATGTERHIFALKQLTGEGEQTFGRLRQLSGEYGINLDDAADAYKKFISGGFKGDQAEKFIKLGADMKALGNTAEDTKGVFLAISQMKALGKVSAEELNQLSERNIGRARMAKNIAKILGKSQDETNKLLNSGKVSAEVGLQAVEATILEMVDKKKAGEAGRDAARSTVAGMVEVAEARAGLFWDKLGKKALPGIKAGVTNAFDGLSKFMNSMRGERLFETLSNAAERFGKAIESLGAWAPKALDAFLTGFERTNGMLGTSVDTGDRFQAFLDRSIPAIVTFGEKIGVLADALSRVLTLFDQISSVSVGGFGFSDLMDLTMAPMTAPLDLLGAVLPANDSGGLVTNTSGGIATVRPAPGEGLASIAAGERIVPVGESMAKHGGVNVGGIVINVDGSGDPQAVAEAVQAAFESRLTTAFAGAMA